MKNLSVTARARWSSVLLVPVVVLAAVSVQAQTPPSTAPTATPTPVTAEKVLGWKPSGNLGLNLSFSSSQDVVGQTDGNSETYGLNFKGGYTRTGERDEWRNELTISEATTKTPGVPRFIKSSDEAKLSTIYLYSLESYPRVGPYAKADAQAPIFKGEDVRGSDATYTIDYATRPDENITTSSLRLTDGFRPLTTKESVGMFFKALEKPEHKIETRAGLFALQIAADGQLAVTGKDATTGNITVTELRDVEQAGIELAANAKGKISENSTYEAGLETSTPFVNNKLSTDDRDALRLTNIEGFVKVGSNITSWAAFGYDYKMKLQPQLVDKVQQIHMLVLNINYNLF